MLDLNRRIATTQDEAGRLSGEIAAHQDHLQNLENALAQEAEIESGFEAYQQAIAQNEALNAKLTELVSLNEQHSELERRIAAARHELDKGAAFGSRTGASVE